MVAERPHGSGLPAGAIPDGAMTVDAILDYLDRRANRSPSPEETLERLHRDMLNGFAEMHRRFDRLDALSAEIRATLARIEAMFLPSPGRELG